MDKRQEVINIHYYYFYIIYYYLLLIINFTIMIIIIIILHVRVAKMIIFYDFNIFPFGKMFGKFVLNILRNGKMSLNEMHFT